MLKINRSILIICIVSLFLIIGQISASDTDSMEINDATNNDLILNQLNDSDMDNLESDEMALLRELPASCPRIRSQPGRAVKEQKLSGVIRGA